MGHLVIGADNTTHILSERTTPHTHVLLFPPKKIISHVVFTFKNNLVDDLKVNARVPSSNPRGARKCIRERLHIVCTTDRESLGLEFWPLSLNATVYIYYRSAKFTFAPSARRLPNTHLHHLNEQDTVLP